MKYSPLSIAHSREVPIRRFEFQEDGSVHYLSVRSHTDIITRHGVVYLTSVINAVLRSWAADKHGSPDCSVLAPKLLLAYQIKTAELFM